MSCGALEIHELWWDPLTGEGDMANVDNDSDETSRWAGNTSASIMNQVAAFLTEQGGNRLKSSGPARHLAPRRSAPSGQNSVDSAPADASHKPLSAQQRAGLALELGAWRDVCETLADSEALDAFAGLPFLRSKASQALQVLHDMQAGGDGIAARFGPVADIHRADIPEVQTLHAHRDAMLQVAVVATLSTISRHLGKSVEASAAGQELASRFTTSTAHHYCVLAPSATKLAGGLPWRKSDAAAHFFQIHVRSLLIALDKICGVTAFVELAPTDFNGGEDANVQAWSRAWGAATAALTTLNLWARGAGTIHGVMQCLFDSQGRLPGIAMKATGSPLPQRFKKELAEAVGTANNSARVDLQAAPMLCQILDADSLRHWQAAAENRTSSVCVSLNALDSEPVRGQTYYRGRSLTHLYLTVWLEQIATIIMTNNQFSRDQHTAAMTEHPPLPDELARQVVPGQYSTVSAVLALFAGDLKVPQSRGLDYYAAPARAIAGAAVGTRELPQGVLVIGPHQVQVAPASEMRLRCFAGIRLPWVFVDSGDALWVDVAVLIHRNGHWRALAVEVEEMDDQTGLLWLRLREGEAAGISMQALTEAFSTAWWTTRSENLGLFLTAAIDLDARLS